MEIIKISTLLPQTTEAKVIKTQITKSGTSVGANYREANRSRSKADFRNKIKICESEASETLYWLEIIEEMKWLKSEYMDIIKKESSEILAIYTSIGKNLKLLAI
ncbi:MAG: four helix bundle protein [Maribacter sp.]|nr:four helix bundle protein [Maribacter sp.]